MQEAKNVAMEAMQRSAKPSAKPPVLDVKTAIAEMRPLLEQALPRHLTADRMIQMATNYVRQNPAISKCTQQSLLGAIMQTSILGLEPVQALGQVYFVPYKVNRGTKDSPQWVDEVQFQIGYRGMLQLIHNSKAVKMIYADIVYEGDTFEEERGLYPKLKHIPNPDRADNAKIIRAYAVAHTLNGGEFFAVLTRKEIEKLRKRNRAQKDQPSGAWLTDYEEMAKAKVIKKLAKYLPLSVEAQRQFAANEAIISPNAFSNNHTGIDIDAVEHPESEDTWVTDYEEVPKAV